MFFPLTLCRSWLIYYCCFSCVSDDEENLVDEGAEDFKPSEPQSKAEARGNYVVYSILFIHVTKF